MPNIRHTNPSATEFIRSAQDVASYFGFEPVATLAKDSRCKTVRKIDCPKVSAQDRRLDALHGILTGGITTYFDNNLHAREEPALFYTTEQVPRSGDIAVTFQVLGVEKSIAEALLLHATRSLLTDIGYTKQHVRVNSMGDRESVARYTRELTNFMRKRLGDMPGNARELMKEHVLISLMDLIERDHELAHRSPSPVEYLSESSRRHFREIVEYLDMSDTLYEIDTRLLGHHHCYSQTLFSIDALPGDTPAEDENVPFETETPDSILVRGGRYDEFVRRLTKRFVPAVGMVVMLPERKAPSRIPRRPKSAAPSLFVVQLGAGPKLKTLLLLDSLKAAQFPTYQAIASNSLSEQLRKAEELKVPYTLILGQKEYAEDTIIVRDMINSSQENVPISELIPHLKRAVR